MGAATPAVLRHHPALTVLAFAPSCIGSPPTIAVPKQGRFAGIGLALRRLTPGACPGRTEPVCRELHGLGENGAPPD
jgi:hypothetical protein